RLPDGSHTLRAVAVDRSGNASEALVGVTVDNTPPVVRWVNPVDGATVGGVVTVNLSVLVDDENPDPTSLQYEVNGQPLSGNTWSLSGQIDGAYTLRATVKDQAGNHGEASIKVTLDNQPPQLTWVAPSPNAPLQGSVSLAVQAWDVPDVEQVYFLAESSAGQTFLLGSAIRRGGYWELTWDTQSFANGPVTLRAVALNSNRLQGIGELQANLNNPDASPPQVSWLDPLDGQSVAGTITLRVRALDNQSVEEVRFFAGGQLLGIGTLVGSVYTFSLDTTGFDDGPLSLKAVAHDASGNRGEEEIQVQVRNQGVPPSLSILEPQSEGRVGVQFTVRASVAKQGTPFTWVSQGGHNLWARVYDYRGNLVKEQPLLDSGQEPPDDEDSVAEALLDLGNVPADRYRLVVEGRVVVAGTTYRIYQEIPVQVQVDSNLPPALVLYQPASGTVLAGGFFYLMGDVTDDSGRVHALEVRLIGGSCASPTTENHLLRYEASPYGLFYMAVPLDAYPYINDGAYCLRVVAVDAQDTTLRNIQELDVRVNRGVARPTAIVGVDNATVTVPGTATWTVNFSTTVRYTAFLRRNGVPVEAYSGQGTSVGFSRAFSDEDTGTWDVVVVFEDTSRRVQGQAQGGSVAVVVGP
uniref:Ig-like domain-containing protein n=1 Tax=Thermus sp. TaxID=275 RepID=UPI00307EE82D